MLNILTTVPTNEPPTPGAAAVGRIDQCFQMAPSRLVLDALVAGNTADLCLYRWNPEHLRWVASAAGSTTCPVGLTELRYDTSGISSFYCLVRTAGTGTGTYSVQAGA